MRTRHVMRLAVVAGLLAGGCTHLRMGLFVLKDNPRKDDPASISQGRAAFEANCAQCHGERADGHGTLAASLPVPPTDFTAPGYHKSTNRISGHIAYGKGDAMPAFIRTLPEDTIWDIGNYLHSLQTAQSEHS